MKIQEISFAVIFENPKKHNFIKTKWTTHFNPTT